MKSHFAIVLCSIAMGAQGQSVSNITCTSVVAEQVMKGLYDPSTYAATDVIDDHAEILCALRTRVSPDSLKSWLQQLEAFGTRHTYSDTVSNTSGIGAVRRWVFGKFQQFSAANDDRLIPAYLQFDYSDTTVCGPAQGWRDVFAVLPGDDTTNKSIVLIEAHMDSRCADNCDPTCSAPGAEDNGSGSALVIELARVMSRYTFHHTIVFMLTIGEEQGLIGADAMATYCVDQGVAIKGVQNNDIVGGILCGYTSSPPSCQGPGQVDSLQVRLFSNGSSSLPHRGFARTVKMYYQEKLQPQVPVPMTISIINLEDRIGRGGDHIPFRAKGFRNLRFTAANEDGDASVDSSWYVDRQHTSNDRLGVDTDGDLLVDSFFVDFNYLQRNAVINGMTATLLAVGPEPPGFIVHNEPTGLRVSFTSGFNRLAYRIGVRNGNPSIDFDAVYKTTDTSFAIPGLSQNHYYYVSVATIDSATVMSPFSIEAVKYNAADTPPGAMDALPFGIGCVPIGITEAAKASSASITLLPCAPDPFTDQTTIVVEVGRSIMYHEAFIVVRDPQGRELTRFRIALHRGTNALNYHHPGSAGIYLYTLLVDDRIIGSRSMVVLD